MRSKVSHSLLLYRIGFCTLNILKNISLLLIICLFGGCLATTTEINPTSLIPEQDKLRYGIKLYQKICTKCHSPRDIRKHTKSEWRTIIDKKLKNDPLMMTEEETEMILYFLSYGSSGTTGFNPTGFSPFAWSRH